MARYDFSDLYDNKTDKLLPCEGCKLVHYCGAAHQKEHQVEHKKACDAINKSRQVFQNEEAEILAPDNDSYFDVFCGFRTQAYIRARNAVADALLKINTSYAVEAALEHLQEMSRLCPGVNLGQRDIIPFLLLRLDREQECYDFIKWWTIIDDKEHYYHSHYNSLPLSSLYLHVHDSDVFESIDVFHASPNLSHLVALTLLKTRLYLDFEAHNDPDIAEWTPGPDRPIGRLARARLRTMHPTDVSITARKLRAQCQQLSYKLYAANPYIWKGLLMEETPALPSIYSLSHGSQEEADLILYQSKRAWDESEDAALVALVVKLEAPTFIHGLPDTFKGVVSNARTDHDNKRPQRFERRKGTRNVFPSKFRPRFPTLSPAELFPLTNVSHTPAKWFISRSDPDKVLVYVDGACSQNEQQKPRGGWAVVCGEFGTGSQPHQCVASGRLEEKGPFGDVSVATSNRAELRAVIAALRLYDWGRKGYKSIVIATDSSYVVNGATGWVKGWVRNGWKTRTGKNVKNKDLWDMLFGEVEKWKDQGQSVAFWKIPRELNLRADAAAKRAAADGAAEEEFKDVLLSPT
ncbi:uncharacterized protein E0L32_001249 [Thyridium curvatum]|uniref:ribonuclease H n=1 Tax=Thyridium curvatum TaxID=1093900 RepID=A0A507AKD8_9PEZI|nr:uncharacterized protein E0L32_001249 [Thyridium curvatum]TPX10052.1 hypothetical protein E0L32_001249 [Thyridium curvatum]